MRVQLNGLEMEIGTDVELSQCVDQIDTIETLEGWMHSAENKSLSLLKSGDKIFLIYFEYHGHEGIVSGANDSDSELVKFRLANGQVDEYPQSWCIEKEKAYEAIAYYFANSGERSPDIAWHTV